MESKNTGHLDTSNQHVENWVPVKTERGSHARLTLKGTSEFWWLNAFETDLHMEIMENLGVRWCKLHPWKTAMDQQGLKHGQPSLLCTLGVGYPKISWLKILSHYNRRYNQVVEGVFDLLSCLLYEGIFQRPWLAATLSKFARLGLIVSKKHQEHDIMNCKDMTDIYGYDILYQVVFWKTRPQEVIHVVSTMVGLCRAQTTKTSSYETPFLMVKSKLQAGEKSSISWVSNSTKH